MSSNRKNRVSRDPDDILSHLVDFNGRCRICGQDHSHTPTLNLQTSMDVISELFGKDSKPKIEKEVLKQHA